MSIKRLIEQKRTLGAKLESTPYVKETTLNWYYDVYGIKYDTKLEMFVRKLARGDFSQDLDISGKRSGRPGRYTRQSPDRRRTGNTTTTATRRGRRPCGADLSR